MDIDIIHSLELPSSEHNDHTRNEHPLADCVSQRLHQVPAHPLDVVNPMVPDSKLRSEEQEGESEVLVVPLLLSGLEVGLDVLDLLESGLDVHQLLPLMEQLLLDLGLTEHFSGVQECLLEHTLSPRNVPGEVGALGLL